MSRTIRIKDIFRSVMKITFTKKFHILFLTILYKQVKQDSDYLISEVHKMLKTHKTFDLKNAYWFSLVEKINKKLRITGPEIATITSIEGMLRVLALYYSGLLPLFPVHDKVFGITVEEVS